MNKDPKNQYAIYDTQMKDFRTMGTFSTSKEALESSEDYFLNVSDSDEVAERNSLEENAKELGFTAVKVSENEAALINQASETRSSIYYSDSRTGSGVTFLFKWQYFSYINDNHPFSLYLTKILLV